MHTALWFSYIQLISLFGDPIPQKRSPFRLSPPSRSPPTPELSHCPFPHEKSSGSTSKRDFRRSHATLKTYRANPIGPPELVVYEQINTASATVQPLPRITAPSLWLRRPVGAGWVVGGVPCQGKYGLVTSEKCSFFSLSLGTGFF